MQPEPNINNAPVEYLIDMFKPIVLDIGKTQALLQVVHAVERDSGAHLTYDLEARRLIFNQRQVILLLDRDFVHHG